MLKRIWNNLRDTEDEAEGADPEFDAKTLKTLIEHFPIGRKIRYFPEYQRDIVFHTIIIAYRVDNHLIYSREAVRGDAHGLPSSFVLGGKLGAVGVGQVRKLQLMVPDTSDMERSLDYIRRANLGRNGQFVRGNTISLIADACQRGIPSLDTEVDSRIKLTEGPYLDNQMVLLRPDFATLRVADQRQKARVQGDVPAKLYLNEDEPPVACVLADFSDVSLRLTTPPGESGFAAMKTNDEVTVSIDLGGNAHLYRLRGTVFRAAADSCVLNLRELYKDGEFVPIRTMDVLEIKTGLLNRRTSGVTTALTETYRA